jgi:predicted nucleic acid-binding protein
MARIVVLDSWPLGLASAARGKSERDRCRAWIEDLDLAGVLVVAPEIADFEVRRELLRTGARAGIRRLESLLRDLLYAPITTPAMRLAAEYWAEVRRGGLPTASDLSLDADCIVAAQAALLCGHGDVMTIATRNPNHLNRFPSIDAREWEQISP